MHLQWLIEAPDKNNWWISLLWVCRWEEGTYTWPPVTHWGVKEVKRLDSLYSDAWEQGPKASLLDVCNSACKNRNSYRKNCVFFHKLPLYIFYKVFKFWGFFLTMNEDEFKEEVMLKLVFWLLYKPSTWCLPMKVDLVWRNWFE